MKKSMTIYKEKKEKDFRMVFIPYGKNKIRLNQSKDYAIISYLNRNETTKIGEFALWALNESDDEVIKELSSIEWAKKYFSCGNRKVSSLYDSVAIRFREEKYIIELYEKEGIGYTAFVNEENQEYQYTWESKPTAKELGEKIMEIFEWKEKYDLGLLEEE